MGPPNARWSPHGGRTSPVSARDGVLPIGKPITNVEITLQDATGRAVPDGEVGEKICISAPCLTGYAETCEQTALFCRLARTRGEATGPATWRGGCPTETCSSSGDATGRSRSAECGLSPPKSNPHSAWLPLIRNAVVAPHQDGTPRLVAYFTTHGRQAPALELLREATRTALPREMVPAEYRWGRLSAHLEREDRPCQAQSQPGRPLGASQPGIRDSFTGLGHAVAVIWRDLLNVRAVRPDDRFLDLSAETHCSPSVPLPGFADS